MPWKHNTESESVFIKIGGPVDVLYEDAGATARLLKKGATFLYDEKLSERVMASIEVNNCDISCKIRNAIDLYMFYEKFVTQDYNFFSEKDVVVFDIGMNVGMSALYLASKENVKKVFAFELFKPTYEQALDNFHLNKPLLDKIEAFDYGLGDKNDIVSCVYSEEHSTACGIYDVRKFDKNLKSVEELKCTVKKASEVLGEKYSQYRSYPIVLKIDAEGAEYDILNDLSSSGFLDDVEIIMMEYHLGKEALIKMLESFNFKGVTMYHGVFGQGNERGMLYAIKSYR